MAVTENGIYYPDDYSKIADVPADMKKMAESIDDAFDENKYDDTDVKDDIKDLQDVDAEQVKKIEALQKENAEQEAEIKRLREDLKGFPSSTAEGEYITLNDSADSRFNEFKIKGNRKQKTRSGKNILPTPLEKTKTSAGITFTINDDGSITLNGMNNGTGSSSIAFYNDYQNDNNPFILKKETKYTVSGMNDINVQLVFYNGTIYANLADRTFTTTETNYSYESIYLQISKGNTTNFDNYTIYPMLEEGSVATEYEQYGESPSSEFPSEIENVEGNVDITICNKNIAYTKDCNISDTDYSFIINNGFINIETNNNLNANFDLNGGRYTGLWAQNSENSNDYHLTPANKETYTATLVIKKLVSGSSNNIFGIVTNQRIINGYFTFITQDKVKLTFTLQEKEYVKQIQIWINGVNGSTTLQGELQLELGTESTDCIAHQGQNFTFPLSEGQKLYEGSYLAEDGIHHVRKQLELDGTENWKSTSLSPVGHYYQYSPSINQVTETNTAISNYFQAKDRWNNWIVGIWFDNNMIITTDKGLAGTETLEEFKQWLAERKAEGNPVIVEYELKTKIIEHYTPEQQKVYDEIVKTAKSYKTVTNIFGTNEVSPKFEINYRQDIKALINSTNKAVLNNA